MKNITRFFWGSVLLLLAVAFGLWLAKHGVKVSDRYANYVGVVQKTAKVAETMTCPVPEVDVTSKDSSARCDVNCVIIANKVVCQPTYNPDYCVTEGPDSKRCACQLDKDSDKCTGKDSRPLCEREPGNLDCVCANVDKARTKECLCRDPKSEADICKQEKPPVVKCGVGQKLVKDKCVDQPITCAADQELVKGKCVLKEPTCGEGQKLIKNACVVDEVKVISAPEVVVDSCVRGQIFKVNFNLDERMVRGAIASQDLKEKSVAEATFMGDLVKIVIDVDQCDLSTAAFDIMIDYSVSEAWCSEEKKACQGVEYIVTDPDGKERMRGDVGALSIVEVKDRDGASRKLLSLGKEKSKP